MEEALDRSQDPPEGPGDRGYVYRHRDGGIYRPQSAPTSMPIRGVVYGDSWDAPLFLAYEADTTTSARPAPDLGDLTLALAAAQAEIEDLKARCSAYERLLNESGLGQER